MLAVRVVLILVLANMHSFLQVAIVRTYLRSVANLKLIFLLRRPQKNLDLFQIYL